MGDGRLVGVDPLAFLPPEAPARRHCRDLCHHQRFWLIASSEQTLELHLGQPMVWPTFHKNSNKTKKIKKKKTKKN